MFDGLAKEKYEEWFEDNYPSVYLGDLYLSLQWGVIQDFADSLGYVVYIDVYLPRLDYHVIIAKKEKGTHENYNVLANSVCGGIPTTKSFPEARTEAIKKLNELINS